MPQYRQPEKDQANQLDRRPDAATANGYQSARVADNYVRITVPLAAVLFLVGIGSTFKVRQVRVVLTSVGAVMLVTAVALIAQQPRPLTKGNHCRAPRCLIHTQQGPEMIGPGQVPLTLLRPSWALPRPTEWFTGWMIVASGSA